MTPRSLVDRLLSPAGFGLALLLFLLPFATVSCSAAEEGIPVHLDYTYTGLDLVTGGGPDIDGTMPDPEGGQPIVVRTTPDEATLAEIGVPMQPVEPLVVVVALGLLVGMIGAFAAPATLRGPLNGGIALGALVLLAVEMFAIIPAEAAEKLARDLPDSGLVTHATPAFGFYLIVVVLVALVAREFLFARRNAPAATATEVGADATGPPPE